MDDIRQLDDPSRAHELRLLIEKKPFLKRYYLEIYRKYQNCLSRCPEQGIAIELGSGAGFVKKIIPEMVTSDTISYPNVDKVVDATAMPYENESLRMIGMLNVFHHIPNVEAFLREAERCLLPGGRVLIVDQYPGWISSLIFKHAHHEPFDTEASDWRFESTGPLSGANGALAWLVFDRDRGKFEKLFPMLKLESYSPHSPFRYWISGGLKKWTLAPGWAFEILTGVDCLLMHISQRFGSFVDIELVKIVRNGMH